jgi:cell wall-associated NlpC family hydrolase
VPSPNTGTILDSGASWVIGAQVAGNRYLSALPNPYGVGASAYEPATEIYTPGTDPLMRGSSSQVSGYSTVQRQKDEAAAKKAEQDAAAQLASATAAATAGATAAANGPLIGGTGSALAVINAAKSLLGKPYVWGGVTAAGVDCSGLLYYAFNAAGIKMPRYRAIDYGKMGEAVGADQARAGDVVYFDNPNTDTDHVGIYLGNGMMIDSPTTGGHVEVVRVYKNAQYRRILNDDQFGTMSAIPNGGGSPLTSYAGVYAQNVFGVNVGATVILPTAGGNGRARAI